MPMGTTTVTSVSVKMIDHYFNKLVVIDQLTYMKILPQKQDL